MQISRINQCVDRDPLEHVRITPISAPCEGDHGSGRVLTADKI